MPLHFNHILLYIINVISHNSTYFKYFHSILYNFHTISDTPIHFRPLATHQTQASKHQKGHNPSSATTTTTTTRPSAPPPAPPLASHTLNRAACHDKGLTETHNKHSSLHQQLANKLSLKFDNHHDNHYDKHRDNHHDSQKQLNHHDSQPIHQNNQQNHHDNHQKIPSSNQQNHHGNKFIHSQPFDTHHHHHHHHNDLPPPPSPPPSFPGNLNDDIIPPPPPPTLIETTLKPPSHPTNDLSTENCPDLTSGSNNDEAPPCPSILSNQEVPTARDSRSDLLSAIREGCKKCYYLNNYY